MIQNSQQSVYHWVNYALIGLGGLLRFVVYFQNRSLFIDEACLSYQLVERPYEGLFANLQYQYAPPLFNISVKGATDLLGVSEYALRLIPLLAGLASLWLFYRLCRHFLSEVDTIYPLLLFAFGIYFVQYSTEVKQYSTDIFFTLSGLLLCLRYPVDQFQTRHFWIAGLLGTVVVWCSMPSVFILTGIGVYYFYQLWRRRQRLPMIALCLVGLSWLVSFSCYYFLLLRPDMGIDHLQDYHEPFFLPFPPMNATEWSRFGELLLGFFRTSMGYTSIALIAGILTFILGMREMAKKDRSLLFLFGLPIFVTLLCSGLRLYSIIPRLTLFIMPIFLLWIGIGCYFLIQKSPFILKIGIALVLLLPIINQKSYVYFTKDFVIEELRPLLLELQDKRTEKEAVYLQCQAQHAYTFYSQFHQDHQQLAIPKLYEAPCIDHPGAVAERYQGQQVWLVFSHYTSREIQHFIQPFHEKGQLLQHLQHPGASAWLFDLR